MPRYSYRQSNGNYVSYTQDEMSTIADGYVDLAKNAVRRRAEIISILAFVLGMLSVPLCWTFIVPVGAFVFGVIGLIMSAKASVNGAYRVFSVLAMVFGFIGFIVMIALYVFLATRY